MDRLLLECIGSLDIGMQERAQRRQERDFLRTFGGLELLHEAAEEQDEMGWEDGEFAQMT